MRITLEFSEGIHIELSGTLARHIEKLLFMDSNHPDDFGKPSDKIFLEIIEKVAETFFKEERYMEAERRWQPPETMFTFKDFHGSTLDDKVEPLVSLMRYAPANKESPSTLEQHILRALKRKDWTNEKIFAAVGQGVALTIIPLSSAEGLRRNQRELMDAFVNTRELISAAAYAINSFAERIDTICQISRVDINWDPMDKKVFDELSSLLSTMYRVMQAVFSIPEHLQSLGPGAFMNFAKDLWSFNNPIDLDTLHLNLNDIQYRLSLEKINDKKIEDITNIISQIIRLPSPFPSKKNRMLFRNK